jgi:hypothetical protein
MTRQDTNTQDASLVDIMQKQPLYAVAFACLALYVVSSAYFLMK